MTNVMADYPKVDAAADLYVNITAADVKAATPRDHCNCAVAQAIKRAVGPDARCAIFPTVAYVLKPTDRATARASYNRTAEVRAGELAWHRFVLGADLTAAILEFDETGNAEALGYQFHQPSPCERLSYHRQYSRERAAAGVQASRAYQHHRKEWHRAKNFILRDVEPSSAPDNVRAIRSRRAA